MNEARLNRLYKARLPIYVRALARVRNCLSDVIDDFEVEYKDSQHKARCEVQIQTLLQELGITLSGLETSGVYAIEYTIGRSLSLGHKFEL